MRLLRCLGEGRRRIHNFLAAAVIHRNNQRHARIVFRGLPRLLERITRFRRQHGQVANSLHAHVFFMQLRHFGQHGFCEQIHEPDDFFGRALPVLRGEGIDSQVANTQVRSHANRFTNSLDSCFMPAQPIFAARFRPAPVAIHNQCNVLRNTLQVKRFRIKTLGRARIYVVQWLIHTSPPSSKDANLNGRIDGVTLPFAPTSARSVSAQAAVLPHLAV